MKSIQDVLLHSQNGAAWKKIGVHPHHGIILPLFSLHSAKSCGIGEFYDLIPLISWASKLKLDTLQLLPLNSLGPDFSPYSAISSCALSELHISCHQLPFLEEHPHLREELSELQQLSKTPRVVYRDVQTHKLHFLHAYIARCGDKLWKKEQTQAFIAKNPWVKPYALFKTLKKQSGEAPMNSWAPHLQIFNPKEQEKLYHLYEEEVRFYILLQYLCFSQLLAVKKHAASQGVHLMGDIPILISRESVDLWCHRECFDIDLAAGAPPDLYNNEGQYWGFPVPRVDILRKTHFHWWKQRLKYASHFYDLFRIDHVIGLFRLWCIPLNQPATSGFFIPQDEAVWDLQGRELLTMISRAARPMLPIAEDLGTLPPTLQPTLLEMGICGTKVMRWEKDWEKTKAFTPIQDYPPVSLTTVGTHDTSPLALWWKEESEEAKIYAKEKGWVYTEQLTKTQREAILRDSHHTKSLFHVNLLTEYLSLFPELTFENLSDERINIPATTLPTNWTYRFRPTVEEITSHEPLKEAFQRILG